MIMDEKQRGAEYALKRAQAGRNAESHIASSLFNAVKSIIEESRTYRSDKGGLVREAQLMSRAKEIVESASDDILSYTKAYSEASCKLLGIKTDVVDDYLEGDIFGSTFAARNSKYMAQFAEDIVRMIKAGSLLGYSESTILSAIRTGYKDPYHSSVITKALKKDVNIATPSYGRGFYKSSYQNLMRNVRATIGLAWGQAEQEYGRINGATGFRVFRGSSYPCAICDDECAYIHKIGENPPLYHANCRCYVVFIYNDNDNE